MSWCSVCEKRNWRTAQSFALIYFTSNCNFCVLESLSDPSDSFCDISWFYLQMGCGCTKFSECIIQITWLFELPGSSSGWLHSYSKWMRKIITLNIWVLWPLLHGMYVKSFLIQFKLREVYGKKLSLAMKWFMNKGKFFLVSFMEVVFFEQNIHAVVRHISMIFITLK